MRHPRNMVVIAASVAIACSNGSTNGFRGDPRPIVGDDSATGDHSAGDELPGDANVGDPMGDEMFGDPGAGDSEGDPVGDPATGDPAGDPRRGDPLTGDPPAGDTAGPNGCDEIGLCIRLTWIAGSGDLDLHLSKDDEPYCSSQSCYFGNCKASSAYRVEWDGNPGLSEGDPTLVEDSWGWGPETIAVTAPADGSYVAGVYYQPSGSGAVTATVEILADGVVVATATTTLLPDGFWEAATVGYSGGAAQNPADLNRVCAPGVWSCNDAVGTCP